MNKYFVVKKNYKGENELRLFWNINGVQSSLSINLNDDDFNRLNEFDNDMYNKDKEYNNNGK